MNVRHLLIAASAAAILAGSSFGALANGWSISKGESHSSVLVVSTSDNPFTWGHDPDPIVVLYAKSHNEAKAPSWGAAEADSHAGGGGEAEAITGQNNDGTPDPNNNGEYGTQSTSSASAHGGASGSACAGSAC
jgi:hypothetical protein